MSTGVSNPNHPFGVGSTSSEGRGGGGEGHHNQSNHYSPTSSAVPSHQQQPQQQQQQQQPQQQQGEGSVRTPNPPEGKKKERQVLRRNQACHQCRRRKLKCDSFRPVCSQCARAQSSFLLSLPPGMAPPTSSEMECVCTYDEMFGPFRKNPNPSAASPASASGSRGGKRERANGGGGAPSSERGIGASSRERGKSTESEKDTEGWNKARQLEMENSELKRQLQASLQSQPQPQPPPPSNGYSSSSHHPSYSSHYDQPPSSVAPPQPQHLPYYPPPPPAHHSMSMNQASQQQYHLPQINDSFAPKANFPWSSNSNYPPSTVTLSYPLSSPGYREEYRGLVDPLSSNNSSIRATATSPPTILEALNIQPPTSSQRLPTLETSNPTAPPQNDPSSPSTSSAHSGNNNGPYLPPLLHPTPGFEPHLHYPFVDSKQQEVFHLPPLASRFPNPADKRGRSPIEGEDEERKKTAESGTSDESTKAEFMLDGSTLVAGEDGSAWRKRVEDRSRIWALVGGPEALEKHIETFNEVAPLLPHVFPPYSTMSTPPFPSANPPPPSAFDSTSPDHPSSLLSRVKLPIDDSNSITPALVLAIAAFAVHGTDEGQALAAEAGRQIIFTRLMAISGETMGSAQGRARRALDVAQAACLLVGLYHITGRWAEFHTFASLPLSLCDLLGLDPDQPECLPEYTICVLAPPVDDVEAEERRRTLQISRFAGLMAGVCSGRGVIGNFDKGQHDDFSEIISLNPLALSLQSVLLLSRVDNFNRSLRPSPTSTSLLSDPETIKKFKGVEATIDTWVASLGSQTGVGTGPSWKGNAGVGELLALKILAEHARVLLYYVHLDHSTSNSQRQACLSAAQSISQSCVFSSTLPVLAIPSYVLHSYFLAGQVLLRFAAAAEAHRDERLLGQLNQQLWSINDTFGRLSGVYPVAANMHKLLDAAIREGSSVLPRSLAMHFDSAFYSPF